VFPSSLQGRIQTEPVNNAELLTVIRKNLGAPASGETCELVGT